jgi:hypothetical protein
VNTHILTIAEVDRKQLQSLLGYSRDNPAPASLLLRIDELIGSTVPKTLRAVSAIAKITTIQDGFADTDVGTINSPTFADLAADAEVVIFALVTAGAEMDQLLHGCEDMVDAMIVDALGSVLVEQGVEMLRNTLASDLGQYVSLPFSPGYCDYPLSEQEKILSTLGADAFGIQYHPASYMMTPVKTISCVLAAGNTPLKTNPCSLCQLDQCQMRR